MVVRMPEGKSGETELSAWSEYLFSQDQYVYQCVIGREGKISECLNQEALKF